MSINAIGPAIRPALNAGIASAFEKGRRPSSLASQVAAPAGFDWAPPISVYRQGSVYTTSYVKADFMPVTTATIFVGPLGNDTTGAGTALLPYRTIKKGIASALALPDASVRIEIDGSLGGVNNIYNRNQHWNGTLCDKNLVIVAVGGDIVSSTRYEAQTWALQSTGVYKATRSAVVQVRDETFQVAVVSPQGDTGYEAELLVKQTSLAACEAAVSSWYTDGATVYIHARDGRIPDPGLLLLAGVSNCVFSANKRWYIEGITFEGSVNDGVATISAAIGAAGSLILERCNIRYAQSNALAAAGIPLVIQHLGERKGCLMDLSNYHLGNNSLDVRAVEIDLVSFKSGEADGVNNDNATTSHEGTRVVRVNGKYFNTVGPIAADINATQTWNLNCAFGGSLSTVPNSASSAAGFTGNTAQSWFESCLLAGDYSLFAGDTSQIRHKGCVLNGPTAGDVAAY